MSPNRTTWSTCGDVLLENAPRAPCPKCFLLGGVKQETKARELVFPLCLRLLPLFGPLFITNLLAADWPMFGRDQTRNAVSPEKNPSTFWKLEVDRAGRPLPKAGQNIKWIAQLGHLSFSSPAIANGYVWIGTNNEHPRDPTVQGEAAVLMCFRESDGEFVWQYVAPRKSGVRYDWQYAGVKCTPLTQDERLWFTTPGADVICLDIGPLLRGEGKPVEHWKFDLMQNLGVFPHPSPMGWAGACSVALYKEWIYVNTGHGVDWNHVTVTNPKAPSLVCLQKESGQVVWTDNSPGTNILHEQWSSPLTLELDGKGRVIVGGGDGKLRAFDSATGSVLWSFDCNPAEYRSKKYPAAEGPSEILAAPVFHNGRVYVAIGQDPEHGEGMGNLVCVDARTGRALWQNRDIQRSLSTVVAVEDRVYAADFSGFVYGLDAVDGRTLWRFDAATYIWAGLLYVDGRLYLGDEDGDAMIFKVGGWEELVRKTDRPVFIKSANNGKRRYYFTNATQVRPRELSAEEAAQLLWETSVPGPIYGEQVYANGVLYINMLTHLIAVVPSGATVSDAPEVKRKVADAIFVPTVQDVVEAMLSFAAVKASDRLLDLGSGDGRILITAVKKYQCKAIGYEIDPRQVQRSREAIRQSQLEHLARIEERDLFTADLSEADVVALYLPGPLLEKLLPQFRQLKPGARIVSHEFVIPGIVPDRTIRVISSIDGAEHAIHLWTAPLEK
ncbi:MAG: PQQ-binding-like beta-propeller repeat protein [Verrucomicrobiota bacterium]